MNRSRCRQHFVKVVNKYLHLTGALVLSTTNMCNQTLHEKQQKNRQVRGHCTKTSCVSSPSADLATCDTTTHVRSSCPAGEHHVRQPSSTSCVLMVRWHTAGSAPLLSTSGHHGGVVRRDALAITCRRSDTSMGSRPQRLCPCLPT